MKASGRRERSRVRARRARHLRRFRTSTHPTSIAVLVLRMKSMCRTRSLMPSSAVASLDATEPLQRDAQGRPGSGENGQARTHLGYSPPMPSCKVKKESISIPLESCRKKGRRTRGGRGKLQTRDSTYAGDEAIDDERSEHALRRPACSVGAGAQSRAEDHEARRGEHAAAGRTSA